MRKFAIAVVVIGILGVAAYQLMPRLSAQAPGRWPGLMTRGAGSSIGATVRDLRAGDAGRDQDAERSGVVIDRVEPEGPAAKAGLRSGDIVVEFDGERVRSVRQFVRLVRETPPNDSVTATVLRDGARQSLDIQPETARLSFDGLGAEINREVERGLRNLPRDFDFDFDFDFDMPDVYVGARARLGVRLAPLSDQLADYFGVEEGVLVSSVEQDSAAARAGLRAGDVILAVGGTGVTRPNGVSQALRAAEPGSMVEIRVMRDKKETTVTATLPERSRPRRPAAGRPA